MNPRKVLGAETIFLNYQGTFGMWIVGQIQANASVEFNPGVCVFHYQSAYYHLPSQPFLNRFVGVLKQLGKHSTSCLVMEHTPDIL